MDLEAEQAFQGPVLRFVIDEDGRDAAVQDVDERRAAGDDVELVPVIDLDDLLELVAVPVEPTAPR